MVALNQRTAGCLWETLISSWHYLHFTDEGTEAQRGKETSSLGWDSNPDLNGPRVGALHHPRGPGCLALGIGQGRRGLGKRRQYSDFGKRVLSAEQAAGPLP